MKKTARRTNNKMHRYLLVFIIDESFDPTLFRILVVHLADLAVGIFANAPSSSTGQHMSRGRTIHTLTLW